jgi:hypothetical protein
MVVADAQPSVEIIGGPVALVFPAFQVIESGKVTQKFKVQITPIRSPYFKAHSSKIVETHIGIGPNNE